MTFHRVKFFVSRSVYQQFDGQWIHVRELSTETLSDMVNHFIATETTGQVAVTSPNYLLEQDGSRSNESTGEIIPTRSYITTTSLTYEPKIIKATPTPEVKPPIASTASGHPQTAEQLSREELIQLIRINGVSAPGQSTEALIRQIEEGKANHDRGAATILVGGGYSV